MFKMEKYGWSYNGVNKQTMTFKSEKLLCKYFKMLYSLNVA